MSVNPVSAPTRTADPAPSRGVDRAPPASRDAKALADEFAAAARKGALPMGGRDAKAPMQDGKGVKGMPMPAEGRAPPQLANALARGEKMKSYDGQSEVRRDDSQTAMLQMQTNGPGLAQPMQAPPPVAAHVDPGAFADMLTKLWTREQGRTAREVRVSFGDAAWPATGARLLRLDDGSLQVTVSMGQRGGDIGGGLDALRERLTARGLNVADIAYEDA
ncbi:hypothetical protein [Glacieibacterium frigidum]|uniref:Uncharacterized protein n=1 Tax=Glacieibacterium frigidum TaxID=2593303 RepID=A0A552UGP2_9SPHN|nr:hypothetical protein [Glacieibacterium frigidum]TRW17376.1 hypothetical protein FMM06_04165 [Glacieibacterium frigidum]